MMLVANWVAQWVDWWVGVLALIAAEQKAVCSADSLVGMLARWKALPSKLSSELKSVQMRVEKMEI